jgi:hypothetical protein
MDSPASRLISVMMEEKMGRLSMGAFGSGTGAMGTAGSEQPMLERVMMMSPRLLGCV